ncbi:MAG: hypothetical protein MK101_12430, partial [Phycisphaerales bacterium]|nr:hypothetical protein [Phycisphaerales bacterium]
DGIVDGHDEDASDGGGGGGDGGGESDEDKRKRLERQLERLDRQIDQARRRARQALRVTDEELDEMLAGDEEEVDAGAFMVDGELWIWGHDLDVEDDAVYSYRISVQVANPMYAKKLSLPESQRPMAEAVAIASDASAWSTGTQVGRPVQIFSVRAMPGGDTAEHQFGAASFDVYRFHDGRWWDERISVTPGTAIGGLVNVGGDDDTGTAIDFSTGYVLIDVVQIPGATAEELKYGTGADLLIGRAGPAGEEVLLVNVRDDRSKARPEVVDPADAPS